MKDQIEEFRAYRAKMNERILAADNKVIKRIYNILSLIHISEPTRRS